MVGGLAKLTFVEMVTRFPNEAAAIGYLEAVRWPNGPYCHRCGCVDVSRVESKRKRPVLFCTGCKEQFSITTGTVMEDTKIELHKWLLAINLMCSSKKGVSSLQLGRMLGIAKRSAWHLSHRIRHAMTETAPAPMTGTVEVDEVYIGGKKKGMGRGYRGNKTAIVTIVQRGGRAHSHVMPEVNVSRSTVGTMIAMHVAPTANLNTDESPLYTEIGKGFRNHDTVNHRADEYVRHGARVATTNAVEGFFGNFDRQINGTHHHVSPKHLHRYIHEFDFKYNTRTDKDGQRTVKAVAKLDGKRLTLFRAVSVDAPCLVNRLAPGVG